MDATQFKKLRLAYGFSQQKLAILLGVTRITIARYESGKSQIPESRVVAAKFLLKDFRNEQLKAAAAINAEPDKQPSNLLGLIIQLKDKNEALLEEMLRTKKEMRNMAMDMEVIKLLMEVDKMQQ